MPRQVPIGGRQPLSTLKSLRPTGTATNPNEGVQESVATTPPTTPRVASSMAPVVRSARRRSRGWHWANALAMAGQPVTHLLWHRTPSGPDRKRSPRSCNPARSPGPDQPRSVPTSPEEEEGTSLVQGRSSSGRVKTTEDRLSATGGRGCFRRAARCRFPGLAGTHSGLPWGRSAWRRGVFSTRSSDYCVTNSVM